jgi:hypothetical protein
MGGLFFRKPYGKTNINAEYPYQVAFRQLSVVALELMETFCQARGIPSRKRQDIRGCLRYCFAKKMQAELFADEFGGDRINVATRQSPDASISPAGASPGGR